MIQICSYQVGEGSRTAVHILEPFHTRSNAFQNKMCPPSRPFSESNCVVSIRPARVCRTFRQPCMVTFWQTKTTYSLKRDGHRPAAIGELPELQATHAQFWSKRWRPLNSASRVGTCGPAQRTLALRLSSSRASVSFSKQAHRQRN